ncbi:DUF1858 domain-containing protein [Acetobacterium paludosum]|uniref:DUF1858 domain-containing protein n=1 Tax=Acetobacterium paludosum TaxID=52693 RepID=A0A923HWL9_9FIRM|nr:DUF1858 domain-containing protein [Acetobacterium paludosum]MBC3888550.1 DUF1858 domain-containing protein [Acetobacterium paludosum]
MQNVDKSMLIGELLKVNDGLAPILLESGMHCLGCPSSQAESLEEACAVHGISVESLVTQLNEFLASAKA